MHSEDLYFCSDNKVDMKFMLAFQKQCMEIYEDFTLFIYFMLVYRFFLEKIFCIFSLDISIIATKYSAPFQSNFENTFYLHYDYLTLKILFNCKKQLISCVTSHADILKTFFTLQITLPILIDLNHRFKKCRYEINKCSL